MPLSRKQQVEVREREAKVLELRKAGASFRAIAAALDYADASGVKRAYDRAMQATIQETADEIRQLELERLDALTRALWPQAMAGKTDAIDRVLSVMNRRAKLLGLDMPTRSEVTVITRDAIEQAITELEAELGTGAADRGAARPAAATEGTPAGA